MKIILLTLSLFVGLTVFSQGKYLTKTGELNFEASVPSFEEVAAKNKAVTAILNTENGEFAALVLVKAFRFKNALMEEHFNENYAESYQYPKATFKGKISDFILSDLGETGTSMLVNGSLNFHGVTKTLNETQLTMTLTDDTIKLSGTFKVLVSDFDIEIPKIVANKLSNEVIVDFSFELVKK